MLYKHEINIINGEEVLFLYLNMDYETAKEFLDKEEKKGLYYSILRYLKNKKIKFNGKKICFVVNGVLISLLLANNGVLDYKTIKEDKFSSIEIEEKIKEPIEIIEDKIDILKEKEENKTELSKDTKTEDQKETKTTAKTTTSNKTNTKTTNKKATTTNTKTTVNKKTTTSKNTVSTKNDSKKTNEKQEKKTMVTVYRSTGIIINIELEEYLIGVVAGEMPASFNTEALKAQAIVARTYTLKRMSQNKILTDTTETQVYKDNSQLKKLWGDDYEKYYNKIKKAVEDTKGFYITYNGEYIDAVYHSTSNGYTEDSINVWGNDIPYLKSVKSKWDLNASPYLKNTTYKLSDLEKVLEMKLSEETKIEVIERSSSSRINKIKIGDKIFNAVDLYNKLHLRSRDFDIKIKGQEVTFTTRGYGHGVGMSQYGANGMAKEGYNYSQIIKYYYKNVEIKK